MAEIDKFTEKIKYIKCRSFLPEYCDIKYTSGILRKLSGKNANGNPGKFSDEQKAKIISGMEKLLEELRKY
ncbi:hypothetical protein [Dysgonomonas macrotermitis]|uniref:Uncharacterized protein n=1 Tax=Dysgonomonas macrotermitis TaxID=1346286 RepID=A0A1M5C3I4_9BACT|nr:hypothetical protein [Dysgonomonas macrotermitis]SHF49299.1 hypothetical protein SAMN05444362_10717 [Dysgonomonas macrotermitis]